MTMASSSFIGTLPAVDALDIIGDVHGEWQALEQLLYYLGYSADGVHPQGRKLVFVGDLCDRGPDSPAVLDWVIAAVAAERAFAVLGNHELNLLMNEAKDGSGWYFQERTQDTERYAPWQSYPEVDKQRLQAALVQWPLVLQRPDLRVVHAAWLPDSIRQLALVDHLPLHQLYQYCDDQFRQSFANSHWFEIYQAEKQLQKQHLYDEDYAMPFLEGMAHYDLMRSHANPVRALACGIEDLSPQPFYINGRWRFTVRSPWWRHYHDRVAVVVGHYWRQWYQQPTALHRRGLFHESPTQWLGQAQQVFCIDFSVGARWRERLNHTGVQQTRLHLAALRWPEKQIMLDNGFSVASVRKPV
ncbi:metallophosphoesterase [Neisseriaceae bacterium ESL0693]|nr:metallophosphoesterase [Neisseriaceae bacterium ESL0693]